MHPLGDAQAEGVSLAVARDNRGYRSGDACLGSDALHNLYGVSGLQNNRAELNLFKFLDRLVYYIQVRGEIPR